MSHVYKDDWKGEKAQRWRKHVDDFEALLEPTTTMLIERLRLETASLVADLGCGGGGSTQRIRASAPKQCVIHGVDISESLIQSSRARVVGDALDFHVVDVSHQPPPAGIYDRLTSRFGVMFFEEPNMAFLNLSKWLDEDGCLAFAVWGHPRDNPWATIVREVAEQFVDIESAGQGASGMFRYAEVSPLVSSLELAGFRDVVVEPWCGDLPIGRGSSADEAARFALAAFADYGQKLEGVGMMTRAHDMLTKEFQPFELLNGVEVPGSVHIVTARGAINVD